MSTRKASTTAKGNDTPEPTRCDYNRLHSIASETPECNKRKLDEDAVKSKLPITPPTKKRCRNRALPTPAQDDQCPDDANPASSGRYPLRSGGKLPTPDASQEAAPQQDSPSRSSSVASSATSEISGVTEPLGVPLRDVDDEDAEDTVDVAGSRPVSLEVPNSGNVILGLDELEQDGAGDRDASVNGRDGPPNSPASTQVVLETPLSQRRRARSASSASSLSTLPASSIDVGEDAETFQQRNGQSVRTDFFGSDFDSADDAAIIAALTATASAEPQDPALLSDADSTASTISSLSSNPHATHPRTSSWRREALSLRRSRSRITRNLSRSTALVNRLLRQTAVLEGDLFRTRGELTRARAESGMARRRAARAELRRWGRDGVVAGAGAVLGMVVWGVVGWVMGPEMEYVRRRRGQVFGM